MRLIYCSFGIMDNPEAPDWVGKLLGNPVVKKEKWAVYNPYLSFSENCARDPSIVTVLEDQAQLSKVAIQNHEALKLDPMLLEPLGQQGLAGRIQTSDHFPSLDVPFKNLYVLLRSDLVLADLNAPEHGEKSQEVLYAYLCNVPVVGIAHRFILSPWVVGKVRAVVFPKTTDDIVQQILAYDHKTTAMIEHYRTEEKAEKEAQAVATKAGLEGRENDGKSSPSPVPGGPVSGTV